MHSGPARFPKRETNSWWYNRSKVEAYGKKFAKILSERWHLGRCQEGILVLVVKNGPLAVSMYLDSEDRIILNKCI